MRGPEFQNSGVSTKSQLGAKGAEGLNSVNHLTSEKANKNRKTAQVRGLSKHSALVPRGIDSPSLSNLFLAKEFLLIGFNSALLKKFL